MPEQFTWIERAALDLNFQQLLERVPIKGRRLDIINTLMAATLDRRRLYVLNIYRQKVLCQLKYRATLKSAQRLHAQLENQFRSAERYRRMCGQNPGRCLPGAVLTDAQRAAFVKAIRVSRGRGSLPNRLIGGMMNWNGPRLLAIRLKHGLDSVLLGPAQPVAGVIDQLNPLLSASILIYSPRLSLRVYNSFKHFFRGNLDYFRRYHFEIVNDFAWLSTGVISFGMSTNLYLAGLASILGPGGLYLTVGLYLVDGLNAVGRLIQQRQAVVHTRKLLNQYQSGLVGQVQQLRGVGDEDGSARLSDVIERVDEIKHEVDCYHRYKTKENKARICVVAGLMVGMATTIAGPVGLAVGSGIVLMFCFMQHRVKTYYLPREEVALSPNASQLIYNKLLQFTDQQIVHLRKKLPKEYFFNKRRCREKIDAFLRARRALLLSDMEGHAHGSEQLPSLIGHVYQASCLSRHNAGEPASLKKLRKLLKPFTDTAWVNTPRRDRRDCEAECKRIIGTIKGSRRSRHRNWLLRRGGIFHVSDEEREFNRHWHERLPASALAEQGGSCLELPDSVFLMD